MARRGLALVVMGVLAGCAVAPSVSTSLPAPLRAAQRRNVPLEGFFPDSVGYTWHYATSTYYLDDPYTLYDGVETVIVEKAARSRNQLTLSLKAIDDFTNRYRFPTLTVTPELAQLKDVTYWGSGAREVEGMTVDFLRSPVAIGNRWDDGDWVGKFLKQESVTVPAGTFPQTWKVEAIGTYDHQYTAVGSYWVAPGTGIVKSELTLDGRHVTSELAPANWRPTGRRIRR